MASLLTLIQVKSQNSRNPFKTHGAIMSLFILSMLVYVVISAWISKLAPNTSYLPILKHVHSIFVTFACGLLLVILVPPVGWLMVVTCASMFVKLLCGAHRQILECITQAFNKLCDWFQNSFQSLCQAGSRAFNLCGWFQNSLQSLYQAVSRAFNRPLMPTELTASSTERQGVEMARIVVE